MIGYIRSYLFLHQIMVGLWKCSAKGFKSGSYRGGTRTFIVRGPGIKAESDCRIPVAGWDLLPTFVELSEEIVAHCLIIR